MPNQAFDHAETDGDSVVVHAGELDHLYGPPDDEVDLAQLRRELGLVRKRGFAVNDGLTETGLTAVGVAVPDPTARQGVLPAIALSVGSARSIQLAGLGGVSPSGRPSIWSC
ncbi:hypothetical protein G4Z16_10550 [Streptomyces bathyalis]|uniref:IclR-ED domain-containing protein n=2 Tax=Streptomyces bathyalis TaxID=2710756 RepID=A0A7T1WVB6_9ACTN|nr:hypothetical protein G4Z16_10550 [Streptomyces bathyalis]